MNKEKEMFKYTSGNQGNQEEVDKKSEAVNKAVKKWIKYLKNTEIYERCEQRKTRCRQSNVIG